MPFLAWYIQKEELEMKVIKMVFICILLLALVILSLFGCDIGKKVTYPSPDPADYAPGGPWERGEPSPSYSEK